MLTVTEAPRARGLGSLALVVATNATLLALLLLAGPVVTAGLLVLGAFGAVVANRPQRGVLVLVALVPFDGLLLLVRHPAIVDGWKEALTIVTLGATFVAPVSARASGARAVPRWLLPVVGLLALSVASGVVVGGLAALIGIKIGFFYLLVALAIWRCPLDARERDRLVTILLTGGLLTATYGLAQQVIGAPGLVAMGYEYNTTVRFAGGYLRSFSSFVQPFGFGFYLMAVVLVTLPGALRDPGRLRSRFALWSLPLLTAGIVSTVVRGAWLGLAVGVVYLAAARHRSLFLLLPLAVVAALLLPPEAASSALSSSSTSQRATGWSENLRDVVRHPLGVGVGSTGASAEKAAELAQQSSPTYQPDNQYFLVLYELGPLGLWLLALTFGAAFAAGRAAARTRDGPDGDLALGLSALIVAAAVASTVASLLQIFPMDVLWWVLLGVAATLPASAPGIERASSVHRGASVAGAPMPAAP